MIRKRYKKYIDMYKVVLITNKEPYKRIAVSFYPTIPRIGEFIWYCKDYYVHNIRHNGNFVQIWVEGAEDKKEIVEETVEQLSLFQEDKSFLNKIKEKCKEVVHLLDKVNK